jgi:hypothetical protein
VENRITTSDYIAVVPSFEHSIGTHAAGECKPHSQGPESLSELIEIARKRAILMERMRVCLANGSPSELREIAEAVCGLRCE